MPPRKKLPGIPDIDPWKAPHWDIEDAGAIQALMRGEAESHQQIRAMQYIVNVLSGYYEISFRPGVDGDRVTAFAEGKRFVGQQIVKLGALNLSRMTGQPSEQG